MTLFHALIRTHHITSRKKVAHLRKAAAKYDCYALLRSGGCPGIMYCKGTEEAVSEWVGTVQVGHRQKQHLNETLSAGTDRLLRDCATKTSN